MDTTAKVKDESRCWCEEDELCWEAQNYELCKTKQAELCLDCYYREGHEVKREQFCRYCEKHDPEHRLIVNVYDVTQHYGGKEEGGWWYDLSECICSVPALDAAEVPQVIAFLEKRFISHGNIHSTRGGELYRICAEYEKAESEDLQRRHYE